MELEFALAGCQTEDHCEFSLEHPKTNGASNPALLADWRPMIRAILQDVSAGVAIGKISARFHNTLAEIIVAVAQRMGEPRVALTGGCFQNCYLTERAVARLKSEGFRPYWHQRVPTNDGGIALGQVVMAAQEIEGD